MCLYTFIMYISWIINSIEFFACRDYQKIDLPLNFITDKGLLLELLYQMIEHFVKGTDEHKALSR